MPTNRDRFGKQPVVMFSKTEYKVLQHALHLARYVAKHDDQAQAHKAIEQLVSHINPATYFYELPNVPAKPF